MEGRHSRRKNDINYRCVNVQCLGDYATCKEDKRSGNLGHYVKRDSMIYADVLVLLGQ